jgi:hypothetical protein
VEDVTVNKSQRSAHRFHQPAISPTRYPRWSDRWRSNLRKQVHRNDNLSRGVLRMGGVFGNAGRAGN